MLYSDDEDGDAELVRFIEMEEANKKAAKERKIQKNKELRENIELERVKRQKEIIDRANKDRMIKDMAIKDTAIKNNAKKQQKLAIKRSRMFFEINHQIRQYKHNIYPIANVCFGKTYITRRSDHGVIEIAGFEENIYPNLELVDIHVLDSLKHIDRWKDHDHKNSMICLKLRYDEMHKFMIENGQTPVVIGKDRTLISLVEGNNRLAIAKQNGITALWAYGMDTFVDDAVGIDIGIDSTSKKQYFKPSEIGITVIDVK